MRSATARPWPQNDGRPTADRGFLARAFTPAQKWASPRVRTLALSAVLGAGFGLRLQLLDAFPLREDEAVYGYWALHLWRVDPWALAVWPDKPPLFLWLLGGFLQIFGPSAPAARLLNIAADTLTIAVVAACARRLWGQGHPQAGLIAAGFYALNPFAISFAPTAYTDPLLVLWGMLAVLAALKRRPFWAGLWLAAAISTKQQGLLYLPLVTALLFLNPVAQSGTGGVGENAQKAPPHPIASSSLPTPVTHYSSLITRFASGLAALLLPIFWWDSRRWHVAPSPWDLSVGNYGGLALLPPDQWLPRLAEWGPLLWHLTASWPLWVLLAVGWGLWTIRSAPRPGQLAIRPLLLALFAGFFIGLHVASSVQIWDRYLLPLAPLVALLGGYSLSRLLAAPVLAVAPARLTGTALALLLALLLTPPALSASRGGYPLGGDHGDYSGLPRALAWLSANAPADAVLYHRALGWHYRFYLFDSEFSRTDWPKKDSTRLELRWFPHPVYLADNAAKIPHRRKFLIEPNWAPVTGAAQRLAARQVDWQPRLRAGNFTVYELVTPSPGFCDWCACEDAQAAPFAPLFGAGQRTPGQG